MPADALFEVMAGCVATIGFDRGMVAKGARFGKRPLHSLGDAAFSTTEVGSSVVENGHEKAALKVLVEAFLLAFCPTCRRADIFHRNNNCAPHGGDLTAISEQRSRFSDEFCSGRLPRRAPFHQSKSKRGIS